MHEDILITELNDFVFCPVSIYFHNLYGNMDTILYQTAKQIDGSAAHKKIDNGTYSTKTNVLMGTDVYCEEFGLVGKIDVYYQETGLLRERKKKIVRIYDGYVFQVYAQCLSLREMGYTVKKIELYSMDDNKVYNIDLPENNKDMYDKFVQTIRKIRSFDIGMFEQENKEKCQNCIYETACDCSLL